MGRAVFPPVLFDLRVDCGGWNEDNGLKNVPYRQTLNPMIRG